MTIDELTDMGSMLAEWYTDWAGLKSAQSAQIWCEARIYAAPRTVVAKLQEIFAKDLKQDPDVPASPDEVVVAGARVAANLQPDTSIWQNVLAEPMVQRRCVMLMLRVEGPARASDGVWETMSKTLVLCGAPAAGAINVKAIWDPGHDDAMQLVYRATNWPEEQKFMEALNTYRANCAARRNDIAARSALRGLGEYGKSFYLARGDAKRVLQIVRSNVELPTERGPAAFARRLLLPLCGAAVLIALTICFKAPPIVIVICLAGVGVQLYVAGRIAWKKFLRVRSYYNKMRSGLGQLYSKKVDYQAIDLSTDDTATLVKSSAELEALGAQHICDVKITTARLLLDGNRIYALGDTIAKLGLLRKTENLQFFPAKPMIIMVTRFSDGRRHITVNKPRHRKISRPGITLKCVTDDGEVDEVYALHHKYVDRMISAGAVPVPPPATTAAAIQEERYEFQQSIETWHRSPYSWSDALHDAFKVVRHNCIDRS